MVEVSQKELRGCALVRCCWPICGRQGGGGDFLNKVVCQGSKWCLPIKFHRACYGDKGDKCGWHCCWVC